MEGLQLLAEYLQLVAEHPVHLRMVRGHVHKMSGQWLAEHTDLRDRLNTHGVNIQGVAQVGACMRACIRVYVRVGWAHARTSECPGSCKVLFMTGGLRAAATLAWCTHGSNPQTLTRATPTHSNHRHCYTGLRMQELCCTHAGTVLCACRNCVSLWCTSWGASVLYSGALAGGRRSFTLVH